MNDQGTIIYAQRTNASSHFAASWLGKTNKAGIKQKTTKRLKTISIFWMILLNLTIAHQGFSIGSISGTVYYRGPKEGDIYILAFDNWNWNPPPQYQVTISDTGPYIIDSVTDGTYWIASFMDADSDGIFDDPTDPYVFSEESCQVQGDSVTGLNLYLDYYATLRDYYFSLIKLSPAIQFAWPGSEDYLCHFQFYAAHIWGQEYLISAWTASDYIEGWGGQMFDDGLHWDGTGGDSIYGHCEVKDSISMHIWLGEVPYWDIEVIIVYAPWPGWDTLVGFVSFRPASSILMIPVLIEPADTINSLQPVFSWHDNGAGWYEVLVWDRMPMPNNLGENIVWRDTIYNDTTIAMADTQLVQGQSYYWALISYKNATGAMEWASFTVDTSYQSIDELALSFAPYAIHLDVYPNPCRGTVSIKYQIPNTKSQTELKIYEVTGRLVRSFPLSTLYSLLPTALTWDGQDDFGRKVPEGVYFLKLELQNFSVLRKLVMIR